MKLKSVAMVVGGAVTLLASCASFAWQPPETMRNCQTHIDPVLHVEFPNKIGDLQMSYRRTYEKGEDDYSLRYSPDADGDVAAGYRHLDLYVYTDDGEPMPDGANEKVQKEILAVDGAIAAKSEGGAYEKLQQLGMAVKGTMPKSGLTYMWSSATLKFSRDGKTHYSFTFVTSWRNRFLKLRYSTPIIRGRNEPAQAIPADFALLINAIDDLIVKANETAKVNVYAIKDPEEAFAALCKKWIGADDRVSQYDLPDFTEKSRELLKALGWCEVNMKERAEVCERVAREGIRLRIAPAFWFHELAWALAMQGKKDETFDALEQSVAAGYCNAEMLDKELDLISLRGDARFAKLTDLARLGIKDWSMPKAYAGIQDEHLYLDDRDIAWDFSNEAYLVGVTNATKDTLIYLDHNVDLRNQPPAPEMIGVEYAEELQDRKRTVGPVNFCFLDVQRLRLIPTILECSATFRSDPTNFLHSVPAWMWQDRSDAEREANLLDEMNVLGVYAIGEDYGYLGVDRIPAWSSVPLACRGFETEELVRLCAEAWRAMRPEVREAGGVRQLLGVIRRGQKCVTNEATFMSSVAMRPAVSINDLDEEKILNLSRGLMKPYPEIPCIVAGGNLEAPVRVCDLFEGPFEKLCMAKSRHHLSFVSRSAEKTMKLGVSIRREQKGTLVWKVLQGDASKVRITKDGVSKVGDVVEKFVIESDYQPAFDIMLADGTKMKSTRIDVGCFRVVDGVASMPAIVSVFYMPGETREYGEDGLLKLIDYTKHQILGWLPKFCPKANFRDEFHWDKNGRLMGWTRVNAEGKKSEFTRDGLAVMTRDALGRPLDVRRDLTMEWMQFGGVERYTNECLAAWCGVQYDAFASSPSGLALAWKYDYKDENDFFGEPSQKEVMPFRYRPDLCARADFTEASGFRLPLLTQMTLGYQRYTRFKYGMFGEDVPSWLVPSDYMRTDSPNALAENGLKAPAELKKMKFCAWKASTNDVWQLDMADFEAKHAELLRELPEGAYRIYVEPDDGSEPYYVSVRETYFLSNTIAEDSAYAKLDRAFRRCKKKEAWKVLESRMGEQDWARTEICEGKPLLFNECPEGIDRGLALWQISKGVYFGILSKFDTSFGAREYFFAHVDADENAFSYDVFEELPSRALGNTVLRAYAGDAEALNNLAVLQYSEVVNRLDYDETSVIKLLGDSAKLGCEQATRNLDVLRYNRGELVRGTAAGSKEGKAIYYSVD